MLVWVGVVAGAGQVEGRYQDSAAAAVTGAVERYRADRGEYPPRLDALVPRYLPAIPPSHRQTGRGCAFVYERRPWGATLIQPHYHFDFGNCSLHEGVSYDFARHRWGR